MNKQTLKGIVFTGLFLIPFIPFLVSSSFFFPFITTKAFAWRIIVEIVFAAWIVLALGERAYRPKKSPVLFAALIFILIAGVANIFAVDAYRSFWSNFERMEGFITLLHLGAFFLVISSVFNEFQWKRWWDTSLAASFVMVIYCLFQLAGTVTINQGGVRVDGTFGNAIYLAVYMLFHIFIASFYMWREWRNKGARWMYGILIFFQVIILYYTATRGALLGLVGGIIIVGLLNVRNKENSLVRKTSISLLLGVIVIVGGFFLVRNSQFVKSSPVLSRFSSLTTEEIKTQGRYFVWPMAIKGFKDRPILGWGQENFTYVFQKYYDPRMYQLEPWFDRAHNTYLDWLVAGGLLGLLGYLSLYASALYLIWRLGENWSRIEKSMLVGLLAAYAFHNFFVFDHLISYVLFFSLLAFLHTMNATEELWSAEVSPSKVKAIALPAVAVVLVVVAYWSVIKPMTANAYLIGALKSVQLNQPEAAIQNFKKAYAKSGFGQTEEAEQMSANLSAIVNSSLPTQKKTEYLDYVKNVIVANADKFPDNARAQMLAGSFFFSVGKPDESLRYMFKAEELSPGKQVIRFQIAEAYIYKKDFAKALEAAKGAYDLDPTYDEAQFTYAVTAIYAGDRELESTLRNRIYDGDAELENKAKKSGQNIDLERWVSDDLITSAYLKTGRYADALNLLNKRLEREPKQMQNYISLASAYLEMGDKQSAIKTLLALAQALPEYKSKVEEYLNQVQNR